SAADVLAEPEYRVEGHLKVSGRARYAADARQTGMLHAVYVRSPYAHALIRSIDVSRARAVPGVHAVLTGADLPEHARFGRRLQAHARRPGPGPRLRRGACLWRLDRAGWGRPCGVHEQAAVHLARGDVAHHWGGRGPHRSR